MKRDFQQRLAKLESQASVWRDNLEFLAVAYYLGNPTEVDYPFDAYGHALGYPSVDAGSTGRRNTSVKSLCWGFKSQGLAWPLVELACHFVQMGL